MVTNYLSGSCIIYILECWPISIKRRVLSPVKIVAPIQKYNDAMPVLRPAFPCAEAFIYIFCTLFLIFKLYYLQLFYSPIFTLCSVVVALMSHPIVFSSLRLPLCACTNRWLSALVLPKRLMYVGPFISLIGILLLSHDIHRISEVWPSHMRFNCTKLKD